MTAAELTAEIKTRLSLTGTFHDNLITALANDVKEYIKSAGADAESPAAVGVIARGVTDLWNFGSGDGKFSEVFYQRVSQLALEKEVNENGQIGTSSDNSTEGDTESEPEM